MTEFTSWLEALWIGMTVHLWQTALFLAVLAAIAGALRGTSSRLLSALYWTGVLKLILPLPLLGPFSERVVGALAAAGATSESVRVTVDFLLYPMLIEPGSAAGAAWPSALAPGLTAIWLGGASWCVLRRLKTRALPAESPAGRALAEPIRSTGLDPDRVRTSPAACSPYVRGGWRPVIVLPQALLTELDEPELQAVLIHEREHLERRDPLRYGVLATVRALFWFYPPLWWLTRRIRETTELACDEAVVRAGLPAAAYCRSLARTLSVGLAGSAAPSAVGILGHRVSFLRRRLERIRSGRRFEAMFRHRLTVAAAAVLALAVSVLPVSTTPSVSASSAELPGEDGVTMPVVLPESKVSPVYPEAARKERIEARVILQAIVKADGSVGQIEVLSSTSELPDFAQAAIAAVEQWRYEPAKKDGKPVDVYFTIRIEFELRNEAPDEDKDKDKDKDSDA